MHLARQLVVVAGLVDSKLHCYNLTDGLECSVVGRGRGAGDMEFNWGCGGVCVTPRGTLLVADFYNDRVPEVDLGVSDRFVRVFGPGDGALELKFPQFVDCNGVHVAVSEEGANRVCVLSYANGSLVGRLRSAGNIPLSTPRGVKLLADGSGVAVADYNNHRVVLLSLAGNVLSDSPLVVQSHADLKFPIGIVQCAAPEGDVAVMVSCRGDASGWTRLMKIGLRSGMLESVDYAGTEGGLFDGVYDIATLPAGGLIALDPGACCSHVFTSLALRMEWIKLSVSCQRGHGVVWRVATF